MEAFDQIPARPPTDGVFRHFVETMTDDAVIMLDPAGRVMCWNQAAERLFGYRSSAMIGRSFACLFPSAEQQAGLLERELLAARSSARATGESWLVRHDGSRFYASRTLHSLRDGQDRLLGYCAVVRDITAQRTIGERLRETQERYQLITRATNDVIWDWDQRTGVVTWNEALRTHFGYAPEETGATIEASYGWWCDRIHPDDRERVMASFEAALTSGREHWAEEYRFRRADGAYVVVLDRGYIVRDSQGQPLRMSGSMLDVTERQRAEQALRQRVAQLHGLAEASLAITAAGSLRTALQEITDHARAIIGAHQAVTSLTIDANWSQAITAVSLSDKYASWRRYDEQPNNTGIYALVCRTNQPMRLTQAELEAHPAWHGYSHAAGKHPPLRGWLAAPLVGQGERNIGLIQLSDKAVGEFTAEDEAILVQLAHLASVAIENVRLFQTTQEALRAREQFLITAAHELKTPITTIKSGAQLLYRLQRRGQLDDDRLARFLRLINQAAGRVAHLTDDLLDLTRLITGQLPLRRQPVDLSTLVRDVVDVLRDELGPQHQVELTIQGARAPALVDPDRIEQVLTNLLDNAIKFSPAGGRIYLTVTPEGDGTRVGVRDEGIGLPRGAGELIFAPFGRATNAERRQLPGLGLGLTICRQIIEQHGGRIWAESAGENQGTILWLWLPAIGEAQDRLSALDHPVPTEGDHDRQHKRTPH